MKTSPNILVIMSDDHGQWASSRYGTRELVTPTMDYLAQTGVKMTHAFTPSPVCSPARACFFTGALPSAHGIHDWLYEYNAGREHPGLDGQTLLGQRLQARGYQTALVGKWHCGDTRTPKPGFDHWFSYWEDQYPHCGPQRFSDNGELRIEHGHQTPLLCDHAIDYLRNKRQPDKPFFLFTSFVDTHSPFADHPKRLTARYRQCSFDEIPDEAIESHHDQVLTAAPTDQLTRREWLTQYYAAVSMIDESVGRLIDALEGSGELENTLIVYTSDHGHMNGHHGLYCKGNATQPSNFLDESILVPCLLSWPGVLPAGEVRDEPVDHCDLFRTVLEAAGQDVTDQEAQQQLLPGKSYLPLLTHQLSDWREAQFCEYGPARMVRTDHHKLILRYPVLPGCPGDALYDLHADPRERVNRIDDLQLASTRATLTAQLEKHFAIYQTAKHSGLNVDHQPRHNGRQGWERSASAST